VQSAKYRVQEKQSNIQTPIPFHPSLIPSFVLFPRHTDTPIRRYMLFLSPLSLLNHARVFCVLFFPFRQVALSLSRQVGRFLSIFPVAGTFHEGYKFHIAGAR
jgi:hypothetical protein